MIRRFIYAFIVLAAGIKISAATGLTVERGSDLQGIIDYAQNGDTLYLGAKTFEANPVSFTEPLCGNCQDSRTPVKASYGFIIKEM